MLRALNLSETNGMIKLSLFGNILISFSITLLPLLFGDDTYERKYLLSLEDDVVDCISEKLVSFICPSYFFGETLKAFLNSTLLFSDI